MAWLRAITAAGIVAGALLSAAGLLAPWWPALDIVNNGVPYLLAGALILLGLAALTRKLWLISGFAGLGGVGS